jgi:hypothetical protein
MTHYPTLIVQLANGMAASSHLFFDIGSDYEQSPHRAFDQFSAVASAYPESDVMPEGLGAWTHNEGCTNGEVLERMKVASGEIQKMLQALQSATKEGLVQAAINDNLPQDFNDLDMDLIASRGCETLENNDLLDEIFALTEIESSDTQVLTDKQSRRYLEIWETLKEREVDIPFGVEI